MGLLALDPEFGRFGERVKHLPFVHWMEVPAVLNSMDINLAPLEQGNMFCRAKSELKYFEAAILAVPTVASRIDPFEFAIVSGENGFLAGDTAEWIKALEALIEDPALRRTIGERARADVYRRYVPEVRGRELVDILNTMWDNARKERTGTF